MRAAFALVAFCAGAAVGETLIMSASTPTVPVVIRDTRSGEVRTCALSTAILTGSFSRPRAASIDRAAMDVAGCTLPAVLAPPVVPAPPSGSTGATAFSATMYRASLAVGRTFIAVNRTGSASGALSVHWTASGPVTPASGDLSWLAGSGSSRFIPLALTAAGVSTLTLPGATAVLTITP